MAGYFITDNLIDDVEKLFPPPPHKRVLFPLERSGLTLLDIAKELGVTKARVLQIEQSAIAKCQRWCRIRGIELTDMLDI